MDIFQQHAVPNAPTEEAPPPYTTLPGNPAEASISAWTGPGAFAAGGYNPSGFKLAYMDFVPRVVTKRMFSHDEYETFDALIQRLNSWLDEHDGIRVVSCETVTWTGTKTKNIFADQCAFDRSRDSQHSTKYIRGLRLWFFLESVPSPHRQTFKVVIQVRTYTPFKSERFDQLVTRVNESLTQDRIAGHVISVETLSSTYSHGRDYRQRLANPNRCFWKDSADQKKKKVFCIRIFAVAEGNSNGYETIGYQDFVPEYNQRNKENKGFELSSDVMLRATQWVARQQGVRFINVQSVDVKLKKKGAFEERCLFTEHPVGAPLGTKTTPYLRVVRVYYAVPHGSGLSTEMPALRLTYRTFAPSVIVPASGNNPPKYEETTTLKDRINQWLQITGAKVFNIETVPLRMSTQTLQMLGPEATFSKSAPSQSGRERWLYHIRLYLDGEYMEPPGAVSLVVPSVAAFSMMH